MNIEKIFNETGIFKDIKLDIVLFESKYPILFTCKDGNEVYLFVCCLVNSKEAIWIGSKTKYETLIGLLKNKVTIREALWKDSIEKLLINYSGLDKIAKCEVVDREKIPDQLLPTRGEYMDAEDDEYSEEISIFESRSKNIEYTIKSQTNKFFMISYRGELVSLPDDYFSPDVKASKDISFELEPILGKNVVIC